MRALATSILLTTLAAAAGCNADRDPASGEAARAPAPATGAPAPAPVAAAPVPEGVQGRYAADAAACTQPGHASHLDIGRDAIAFHESSGPVLRSVEGADGVAITAELTGEGETRQATYRFRLAPDGSAITDLDGGLARVRCR